MPVLRSATESLRVDRFFLGAICGAVAVGVVLVVLLLVTGSRITDQEVKVPSLLGDRPTVAKAKVEALGLKAHTVQRASLPDPLGLFGPTRPFVARQVPDHGALIPSGGTVTLFVDYR
jgi:beta-lactam-binding protein with PASTA domain